MRSFFSNQVDAVHINFAHKRLLVGYISPMRRRSLTRRLKRQLSAVEFQQVCRLSLS